MSDELVSVIVPCYNHEEYILDLLESIHRQTYKRIELIVFDDRSTDGSASLIERALSSVYIQARFERVIFRKNRLNAGSIATIDAACRQAKGKYTFLTNSDDLFDINRIQKLVDELSYTGRVWGFSDVKPIDRNGNDFDGALPFSIADIFDYRRNHSPYIPNDGFCFSSRNIAISSGNLVFLTPLREILTLAADMKYCGDYLICLCLLYIGLPAIVEEDLYLYRIHDTNSFQALADLGELEIDRLSMLHELLFRDIEQPINLYAPAKGFSAGVATEAVPYLDFSNRRKKRLEEGVDILDLVQWDQMLLVKRRCIDIWSQFRDSTTSCLEG